MVIRRYLFTAVVFAGSLSAAAAHAQSGRPACEKLRGFLTQPPGLDDNPATMSFGARRSFYSKEYTTPGGVAELQSACQKYYTSVGETGTITAVVTDVVAGSGDCYVNGEGPHRTIPRVERPREEQCYRTPNGPYKDLGTSLGSFGEPFSSTQKRNIREANKTWWGGNLHSDARTPRMSSNLDPHNFLVYDSAKGVPDDEGEPPLIPFWVDEYVNIDHIIPRKDIFGCDCGPNSYANALVVSREFNIAMSNDLSHVDRKAILRAWSTP